MRLICPNCDAQYEVDDNAIPAVGRDVQCSNCGHGWFQLSTEAEDDLLADDDLDPDIDHDTHTPELTEALPPSAPKRRELDENVLSVLREEAELETAARRSEARPIETQADLGLDELPDDSAAIAARRRVALLKGEEPEDALGKGQRRELLPDIEEINSTLRATTARRAPSSKPAVAVHPEERRRSGFRTGFSLMIMLTVVLALTYVMAPRIVTHIPGSAETMRVYVETIDKGRADLDVLMKKAITILRRTLPEDS